MHHKVDSSFRNGRTLTTRFLIFLYSTIPRHPLKDSQFYIRSHTINGSLHNKCLTELALARRYERKSAEENGLTMTGESREQLFFLELKELSRIANEAKAALIHEYLKMLPGEAGKKKL